MRTNRQARPVRPYKAVLFDLDNTLGDRPPAVRRWAEKFYFSQPGVMARVEREEAVARIVAWDAGGHVFARQLFESMVAEWPFVREGVDELVGWHSVNYPAAFRPVPEMTRVTNRITRAGIPWGIVTNGPSFQREKVVALGLEKMAVFTLVSLEFGAGKPGAAIFEEGIRLLGEREAGKVVYVGDSPTADIVGAHSAGLRAAWMSLGRKWPANLQPPDHVLNSLEDLLEVLGI